MLVPVWRLDTSSQRSVSKNVQDKNMYQKKRNSCPDR